METKKEIIKNSIEDFTTYFRYEVEKENIEVPEITDDVLKEIITEYFNTEKLTDAEKNLSLAVDKYVKDTYSDINWDLERDVIKETPEYKQWDRHNKISSVLYSCRRKLKFRETWVLVNGKAHTEEEAAKIAADKWCELLFKWHLQDNGAINEDHGGGFYACALATVLGNDAKENITDEMKQKAHELFQEYYLRLMHYSRTFDDADVQWLKDNLPDIEGDFDWNYGFSYDMYCDYDPSYPLYLILFNAGIPEKDIRCICPWKTGISIREEDNAVMYNTYQHTDEL